MTQKRHASLTVARAKELKDTLPELTIDVTASNENRTNNTATQHEKTAETAKENASQSSSPTKKLGKSTPDTLSVGDSLSNKSPVSEVADNSFFDDVMAATAFSPNKSTDLESEEKSSDTAKVPDTNNDIHSSMSSLSSSGSKRSHKSRSINNLFFGKSDKNKSSSKRRNKVSRQSSSSSVTSTAERGNNTTDTISDSKSIGSPENTPAVTSSTSSLRSHRKSSSSSTTSFDRVSRDHPPQASSHAEAPPGKPRSVRIRPSAAVARARPRAAQPQTGANNPKNPPMFKTKSRIAVGPGEQVSETNDQLSNQPVDSPASVRSSFSATSKEDASNSTLSPKQVLSENDDNSWACFDEKNSTSQQSKTEDPFASAAWETSDSTKPQQTDAWNAFGDLKNEKKEENKVGSEKKAVNSAFLTDTSSNEQSDSKAKVGDAWNDAFGDLKNEKKEHKVDSGKKAVDSAFPTDPFSNEQNDPKAKVDDAWNDAFGDLKNEEKEQKVDSEKKAVDSAFSTDPFSIKQNDPFATNEFESQFSNKTLPKEAWSPFGQDSSVQTSSKHKKDLNNSDFPKDPFANSTDSGFNREDFESCDPFAETSADSEDPFQNYEAVFGLTADANKEETRQNQEEKDSTPQQTSSTEVKAEDDPFQNIDVVFGNVLVDNTNNENKPLKSTENTQEISNPTTKNELSEDAFENLESVFGVFSENTSKIISESSVTEAKTKKTQSSNEDESNTKAPLYDFDAVFGVAPDKDETKSTKNSKISNPSESDSSAHKDVFDLKFFETLRQTPPIVSKPKTRSSPAIPSRTSSVSSRKSSFHSSASSKKTHSPNPPEEPHSVEHPSWATFPTDQTDVFDNVPFKTENAIVNPFSPLPAPTSPPPPLPPRPPRRISTPAEDENLVLPSIPPPPLPVRPRMSSRVIEDDSSNSENEGESNLAPPSFLPPQLPPELHNNFPVESENRTSNVTYPTGEVECSFFKFSQPPFSSSDAKTNSQVNIPPPPPAIPKRSRSKGALLENKTLLQVTISPHWLEALMHDRY